MVINIQDDILRLNAMGLLTRLLQDKATGGNVLWATNAYSRLGEGYEPGNEIRPERITGENSDLVKTRARRAMEQRTERTRQHAEVCTPCWVVSKMNDFCDQQWFGREDGIHKRDEQGRIRFTARRTWRRYVDARRMEITTGEAPFLCSRYNVETGEYIEVAGRIGLLDRKLRAVSENTQDIEAWKQWALRAVQSVYGYELQGDNLLIARVNILCTVEEHLFARWRQKAEKGWLEKLCNVIAWNLWQMDGLSGCVPVLPVSAEEQLSLFPLTSEETNLLGGAEQKEIPCRLYDWRGAHSISYKTLREEGKKVMKFDFIIGNPPYQEEQASDNFEGSMKNWLAKEYIDEYGQRQKGLAFDLLVVDEAQEGVETYKTEKAFDNILRAHTLYLSGTPFKQLAGDQFADGEIFNWSYADEQDAKTRWAEEEYNPYENLPKLLMYTYQLSPMIYDTLSRGIVLEDEDETVDPAFDLNEFFRTDDNGKLVHRDEVKKFLLMLFKGEKYPFSTPELRRELSHTMWYLNRVASARALHKLMREDAELRPLFAEYEIVLAAGDGRLTEDEETKRSYDKVREAIKNHEKTITLTVGQLTVGVTIPEWSGVFMLCNMQSPSSYMQAAFRAQNPYSCKAADGRRYRKERAYLFDFDPARTLIIYDQFANNLIRETATGGTTEDREQNIKRLLNFFPVLGEDENGSMVELDAAQVLTIPRKLKSAEVVRHGFMSNFLFANISGIFGAAGFVREIIEKLTPAHEEGGKSDRDKLDAISTVTVDEEGNTVTDEEIVIGKTQELFGEKIYETIPADVEQAVTAVSESEPDDLARHVKSLTSAVKDKVAQEIIAPIADSYGMTQKAKKRMEEQTGKEIERAMQRAKADFDQQKRIAEAALDAKRKQAETEQEVKQAEAAFGAEMQDAMNAFTQTVSDTVKKTLQEKPKELVERLETKRAEDKRKSVEDEIRAHLRGFARTIPSFIMAYGDENLTLSNFDEYTEDEVFLEVTGISEGEFRFLRDGGERMNPETGLMEHYEGHLFDEGVFNDSIREFLRKRRELANYFDESKTEDIFDYIPPQKTNAEAKAAIDAAVQEAVRYGVANRWGGSQPPKLDLCVHDGDGPRPSDGQSYGPEWRGCWVFTASSKADRKPFVVDRSVQHIIDPTQIYSGVWANVSVSFFAYNAGGKKGVGCGLNGVQKVRDDEPLGSTVTAESAFSALPLNDAFGAPQQPFPSERGDRGAVGEVPFGAGGYAAPAYQPAPAYPGGVNPFTGLPV